jgi:hypothetical protein
MLSAITALDEERLIALLMESLTTWENNGYVISKGHDGESFNHDTM